MATYEISNIGERDYILNGFIIKAVSKVIVDGNSIDLLQMIKKFPNLIITKQPEVFIPVTDVIVELPSIEIIKEPEHNIELVTVSPDKDLEIEPELSNLEDIEIEEYE